MDDSPRPDNLEIVNPQYVRGPFRCAVFDFDGTLSLLRGNWQGLMAPLMVETLLATRSGESAAELTAIVREFITRLTGQPTMQQMIALADEVEKRGRPRPRPEKHLAHYLDLLLSRTNARIHDIETGRVAPDEMLICGSRRLIERLQGANWLLAIASGTELADVRRESRVLKIDHYFGPRVFGPVNNDAGFSKESALRSLIAEQGMSGGQIVAIGDGPAEMLAIKAVGGLAIGVASDEVHRDGHVNLLKREHLLRAGADVIIPDYRKLDSLLRILNPEL